MNAAALALPKPLRILVDSRLDAIERALLQGNTPRAERQSILEDIETQIVDMLSAEALDHEPTRADLLRVLARLDPPEAFTGEHIDSVREAWAGRGSVPNPEARPTTKRGYATTGILACVGGLTTMAVGLPLSVCTMFSPGSEVLILVLGGFLALTGIPALVLGIVYAIVLHQSRGQFRGLTCAAIGISALPINVAGLLLAMLMATMNSVALIFAGYAIVCVLAVVGAIHLTYRGLELLIGAQQRPA
jgi:hypothetical protein